jgi:aminopeptidase N
VFATTGNEVESVPKEDLVTHHFVSGPTRDFVMAADADFQVESITVGETVVNSYFNPDDPVTGHAVLTAGAQALEVYNRLGGEYPYEELDLAQIDLGNGAGGVEFPQLVFISGDYYGAGNALSLVPGFLEFVVAHEVAHQWWYGLVGNNQYLHAFIDEGLSNYLTIVYFEEIYGEEAAQQQVNYNLKATYFTRLFNDGDEIVDQPTDDFPSQRSYGSIVYGKAALGFGEVRAAIGDEAFFNGLRGYVGEFRFKVAAPSDLKAAFESASGMNLDELWHHWFEAAEGKQDYNAADLARLLRDIGR